jgi:hypothetical protein
MTDGTDVFQERFDRDREDAAADARRTATERIGTRLERLAWGVRGSDNDFTVHKDVEPGQSDAAGSVFSLTGMHRHEMARQDYHRERYTFYGPWVYGPTEEVADARRNEDKRAAQREAERRARFLAHEDKLLAQAAEIEARRDVHGRVTPAEAKVTEERTKTLQHAQYMHYDDPVDVLIDMAASQAAAEHEATLDRTLRAHLEREAREMEEGA